MTEKEYWYWLLNLEQIGPASIEKLLLYFKTPEALFQASIWQIKQVVGINRRAVSSIISSRNPDKIKECYAKLLDKDIYLITETEEAYPEKLKQIYRPPYGLYVKGKMPAPHIPCIAIVGARSCSRYGSETARYFAKELSEAGIQVISGLAKGIDGYAHEGALQGSTPTFGILGCGIDICYPRENERLFLKLPEQGGILSEYPPGRLPNPAYFPMRNRIISGLSDGILVVEAREKSGSLITADYGLDQGKPVFAIPGRVDDSLSRGTDNLIKQGAALVTEPSDIIGHYQMQSPGLRPVHKKSDNLLETNEKIVYASLGLMPRHINELIEETKLSIMELMTALVALEMKGAAAETAPGYYAAVKQ